MRIKLIKDAPPWRSGAIIPFCARGQAKLWIARGIAVEVDEDDKPESATITRGGVEIETATAGTGERRGRKRKNRGSR